MCLDNGMVVDTYYAYYGVFKEKYFVCHICYYNQRIFVVGSMRILKMV